MSKEAMKLALEAYMAAGFGNSTDFALQRKAYDLALQALAESALERMAENARELGLDYEQPARQEPYCYTYTEKGEEYFAPPTAYVPDNATPLYTFPPTLSLAQRTWIGLSDLDIDELENEYMKSAQTAHQFLRAVEAKLKAKNSP